jgi:hypothetical protein
MSEWWTYTLQDFLLFSPRTYYRLFELYNLAIWPAQFLALTLGLAVLALLVRPSPKTGQRIAAILALAWFFVAWAYFNARYASINWIAPYFAAAFLIEALLLAWAGIIRRSFSLSLVDHAGKIGLCLFLFALFIQPMIGPLLGRPITQSEVVGLMPDPTAIATLGLLLIVTSRYVISLLIIPLAWCIISAATLWTMGSPEAWVMLAAPLICMIALLWRKASN